MKVGTKSLLFGVHQFIWHPFTVVLAWNELYGMPNWKEILCIFFHDWGYFGRSNMDGDEGSTHPELGARIILRLLKDNDYYELCLYHSRSYTELVNERIAVSGIRHKPSKLCWADKLSIKYDPWFLYIPRAILSGEITEYRVMAAKNGYIPMNAPHRSWYQWASSRFIIIGNKGGKDGSYKKSDILT